MPMTGPGDRTESVALWRRWRQGTPAAANSAAPDSLLLAAWADGRLDEAQAEPVETWLADHPEAMADLLAAQQAALSAPPAIASEALIARAAGLVPSLPMNVVPLRRSGVHAPLWLSAIKWGGLAASLVVTSLVGFALGNNAYVNFAGQPPATESVLNELLDPPLSVFSADEDQAT
jgi:anti-sigma factor RsiW